MPRIRDSLTDKVGNTPLLRLKRAVVADGVVGEVLRTTEKSTVARHLYSSLFADIRNKSALIADLITTSVSAKEEAR